MHRALKASSFLLVFLAAGAASAQVSLTGPAYTQNFDSLSNTAGSTTNNLAIPGWLMTETGGGARDNEQYAVDTGASNTGDTFSYGAAAATDRALGSLRSGTLISTYGACFTNNTGGDISALDIAYTGEQWRLGTAARTDRIDFQYSLDATSLTTGTWVDVNGLDFDTRNTATVGAKDGNITANRVALSSRVSGLAIDTGAAFCIRWTDLDASGADDGLSVDDFSLTPTFTAPAPDMSVGITGTPNPVAAGGTITLRTRLANESTAAGGAWSYAQTTPGQLTYNGDVNLENAVNGLLIGCTLPNFAGAPVNCNGVTAPGQSAVTLRMGYSIAADAVGPLVVSGVMTGPAEETELGNNTGRLVITLLGQEADLSVVVNDDADPVAPGGTLVYTATVANNGPGAALDPQLGLQVPANTTYVSSSFDPAVFDACSVVAGWLRCTRAGLLASGVSGNVEMTVQVAGAYIGALSANATVASAAFDNVPANNDAAATTQVEVPLVGIHDIQGSTDVSPRVGALVRTEGIVTALRTNGFNLQTATGEEDANALTSQGILVFTGGAPPAAAALGNRVSVSGTVTEFRSSSNPHQGFVTEITSPSVTLLGSGTLPAPVEITAALTNPAGPIDALERLEGMRVSIASFLATAPGEGFIDENDALSTANGLFWGVVQGVPRPFREPGVGVLDTTAGLPVNTPRFDTNPERIRVQSTGLVGAPIIALDAGAVVTGLVGVLDYGFGTYTLLPDPTAPVVVTGGAVPEAVADATPGEITIAGFNLLRFYDDVDDAGGDVALTTLAFERRVRKTADAICTYVRLPDVLGVVEVENLNALQRLADAINTNLPGSCARNPQYVAYLEEGNDVGKINIGFLVSTAEVAAGVPRVEVQAIIQHGKTATITNPNASTSVMNDRPPLQLNAVIHAANGSSVPVTVLGNHNLALSSINEVGNGTNGYASNGQRRRVKRAEQAVFTANVIHQIQQADPTRPLVLVGDFNAFEFNDGYVDVMGIMTGREAANDAVLEYRDSPITAPLTNMTTQSAPEDRYSYSFEGNVQVLDHIVVNQAVLDSFASVRSEHARINADFGTDNFGDDSVALRVSDHDPVVLYLADDSFLSADLAIGVDAPASAVAGSVVNVRSTLRNTGPDAAANVLVRFRADAELWSLAVTPPTGFSCGQPVIGAGQTLLECGAGQQVAGEAAFDLVVRTLPSQATAVTLSATVEATSTDAIPGNNTGSDSIALTSPGADLAVSVVKPSVFTWFSRDVILAVQVHNRGPDAAQSPQLAVAIAAGDAQLSALPAAGWSCSTSSVTPARTIFLCSATGAYSYDRSDTLQFRIRAERPTFVLTAAALASPTSDPNPGNNNSAATFPMGLGF